MESYEITYLIVPSFTTVEASAFHEEIKKSIKENKGVLGSEQIPTKKTLAYPINKETEGYLASVDFEAEKEDSKKIKEKAEKEKDILRYLVIRKQVSKRPEKERAPRRKTLKPEKATLQEIDDKIDEIL